MLAYLKARMTDVEKGGSETEEKGSKKDVKFAGSDDSNEPDSAGKTTYEEKPYSFETIKDFPIWKKGLAEFMGTLFLVLVGCGSATLPEESPPERVDIAFAFGLIVAVMVQCTAHISGGHLNPAVTASMLATRSIPIIKGCVYIVCQFLGAIVGAAILFGLQPSAVRNNLGVTMVSDQIATYHAFGIEFLITFVLVFAIFSLVDPSRPFQKGVSPVLIGLTVAACHLWAIPYTGSSMNTARSFGPALIMNKWEHHWVYWVGPIPGGIFAGLMYNVVFSNKSVLDKGV